MKNFKIMVIAFMSVLCICNGLNVFNFCFKSEICFASIDLNQSVISSHITLNKNNDLRENLNNKDNKDNENIKNNLNNKTKKNNKDSKNYSINKNNITNKNGKEIQKKISVNVDEREEVRLPVIMYHSILNSKKGRYIVSEKQLENDLIALTKNGYESVFSKDIINFVEGCGQLPEKPVLITFDDGHYNNISYGLPLLQKHNHKAVFNIVGAFSEFSSSSSDNSNPNYSHITWLQIVEAQKSGHVEIGNHTYNMHSYKPRFGISKIGNESDNEYENSIKKDIKRLDDKLLDFCSIKPNIFAYPFGKYTKISEQVLNDLNFPISLTCNEGVSILKKHDAKSLRLLRRVNREGDYSTTTLISKIEKSQN